MAMPTGSDLAVGEIARRRARLRPVRPTGGPQWPTCQPEKPALECKARVRVAKSALSAPVSLNDFQKIFKSQLTSKMHSNSKFGRKNLKRIFSVRY